MSAIHCVFTALEPITHMSGIQGNVAIINRETILTPNGIEEVPILSGNAIRHNMLRQPAADVLIEHCDMAGRASFNVAEFLYHGGNLTSGGKTFGGESIAQLIKDIPFIEVFGGSLPSNILPGAISVGRGILVCRETSALIKELVNAGPLPELEGYHSYHDYITGTQYTRSCSDTTIDDRRMIYTGEAIARGAKLYCRIEIEPWISELGLACILSALTSSRDRIGGTSRIGHGKLEVLAWLNDCTASLDTSAYTDYLREHGDTIRAILDGLFAAPEKAAKKRGK